MRAASLFQGYQVRQAAGTAAKLCLRDRSANARTHPPCEIVLPSSLSIWLRFATPKESYSIAQGATLVVLHISPRLAPGRLARPERQFGGLNSASEPLSFRRLPCVRRQAASGGPAAGVKRVRTISTESNGSRSQTGPESNGSERFQLSLDPFVALRRERRDGNHLEITAAEVIGTRLRHRAAVCAPNPANLPV
jgi:hypothetical protein